MGTKRVAKIVIDRDLCIGAASCVTIAPGVFRMDDAHKAVLIPDAASAWADFDTVYLAAQSCPTKAIFLYDADGNQLYPEE